MKRPVAARETAELTNAIQKFFIEVTHGSAFRCSFTKNVCTAMRPLDATSFPQPIGSGRARSIRRLVEALSRDDRVGSSGSRHAPGAFTPVETWPVIRDGGVSKRPTAKTHFSTRSLGIAAVRGFQGDAKFKDNKETAIATLKHFAAHGQPESGMNCAPANVSERVLRETFLHPFSERDSERPGCISVMATYNEIDGVPSHASQWLLREVLRKEWGFTGFVVQRLLLHLGAALPARHPRTLCWRKTKKKRPACGGGGGEYRAAGTLIAMCIWSNSSAWAC